MYKYSLILGKASLMWSIFTIVQKLVPAPPTCLYSHVAPFKVCISLWLFCSLCCYVITYHNVDIAKPRNCCSLPYTWYLYMLRTRMWVLICNFGHFYLCLLFKFVLHTLNIVMLSTYGMECMCDVVSASFCCHGITFHSL